MPPHRKIYRDNIQGVTKNAIQRMMYTAGITRAGGLCYEETRGIIKVKLEDIIYKIIIYLEHLRKKTVDEYIVAHCVTPKLYTYEPIARSCLGMRKRSKSRSRRSRSKRSRSRSRISRSKRSKSRSRSSRSKRTKSRSRSSRSKITKSRSSIVKTLKNIKFFQNRYECLNISMLPFSRIVREVTQDYKTDVRYTKKALILLQYSIETYIVKVFKEARNVAMHAKRTKVEPKDINIARRSIYY